MRISRHSTPTTTVTRAVADGSTPAARPRRVAHRRSGGRRAPLVLLAVVAVLSLGACGDSAPDLDGRSYTSTEVRGHDLVAGSTVTLTFEDGRISAECRVQHDERLCDVDGGTLDVAEPMASTMMACRGRPGRAGPVAELLPHLVPGVGGRGRHPDPRGRQLGHDAHRQAVGRDGAASRRRGHTCRFTGAPGMMRPMAAFDVHLDTDLPAAEAWRRVLDLRAHSEVIPLTTVTGDQLEAAALVPGSRFVGPHGSRPGRLRRRHGRRLHRAAHRWLRWSSADPQGGQGDPRHDRLPGDTDSARPRRSTGCSRSACDGCHVRPTRWSPEWPGRHTAGRWCSCCSAADGARRGWAIRPKRHRGGRAATMDA